MSKQILMACLLLTIAAVGCVSQTDTQTGTGNLVLQITDQPSLNIENVEVTISKVQVHMANTENTTENITEESGWITVIEGPKTYDLMALKNVKEFLGEKELETGIYTQIRLDVDKAVVTINGTPDELTIPSKTIKLVRSFVIEANKTTVLTLDFMANESIHPAGNKYIMRPMIKIIQENGAAKKSVQQSCTDSGGTVATANCCQSSDDFPNTCLIGACGCSPGNSHEVKTCVCGEGKCFDGTKCV